MKYTLFFLFVALLLAAQPGSSKQYESFSNLQFNTFSTQQGLSQSSVLSITQDPSGFIWMGTKDGLNRFDGYKFRTYKTEQNDSNSLSNNEVNFLNSDSLGNIFIGTRGGGLNYFISDENRFKKYENLKIVDGTVNSVSQCNDGSILVGTSDGLFKGIPDSVEQFAYHFTNLSKNSVYLGSNNKLLPYDRLSVSVVTTKKIINKKVIVGTFKGLFVFDGADLSFTQVDIGELNDAKITSMVWDHDSLLWVGTSEGLAQVKFERNIIETVSVLNNSPKWKATNATWVEKIIRDSSGDIWIATRGAGLIMWDSNDNIHNYYNNPALSSNIGDNIINSLLIDNSGILWIGTESRGVVTLDLFRKKFNHLENYTETGRNLTNNLVTAITSNENEIWVGSAYNGLDYLNFRPDNTIETIHIDEIPYNSNNTSNEIISLMLDNKETLWIGTASNYLVSYDKDQNFKSYPTGSFAFALHEDRQDDVWIGTWGKGLGYMPNPNSEIKFFANQPHDSRSLSGDVILSIFDDNHGNLWVGTKGRGLNVVALDIIKEGYNNFIRYENDKLLHNDVYCVLQDSEGIVWIGTGGGLNKIDIYNDNETSQQFLKGRAEFEAYTEKDGLPANLIYGLLEDANGNIWISTTKGLSRFNKEKEEFVNYDANDGLQSNEFHSNAFFSTNGEKMFFGGVNGLTFFNPNQIYSNNKPFDVVISGLKVLNKQVLPNKKIKGKVILDKTISNTKEITLNHKHKDFSIEFSALHLNNLEGVQYAYRLIGFDDEWRYLSDNEHSVTYTNLWEGDYKFQVKATNDDGIWNEQPTGLIINVKPPLWRSILFYPVYLLIIILGLLLFRKYSLIKVTEKNKLHIEHIERSNLIENTEAKMRFFTNISHEIRTPLTLISNPLEDVINHGEIDENSKSNLKLVAKNVNRLIHLTNQFLQLRKIDKGGVEPHYAEVEINNFLKEIISFFLQKSFNKEIHLNFRSNINEAQKVWIDTEMITTAVYNVISNAFKFTPEDGEISVSLYKKSEEPTKIKKLRKKVQTKNWICIDISDNGSGISPEEVNNIFHRFYQSKQKNNSEMAGSGIGLSIVKEYIDLNQGKVEVKSKQGVGTMFTIYLPTGDEHIKNNKISLQPVKPVDKLQSLDNNTSTEETGTPTINTKEEKPTLLIVEDDKDLCSYLENALNDKFNIETANDGSDGIKKASKLIPNLIISDVMMPNTDGLELTNQLKNEEKTRHIPIILLTAKAADESKMEGYRSGADLYVSKPFKLELLKVQIDQLMASRKVLSEIFSKQIMLSPRNIAISSNDEKFLTRLNEVIDDHLSEPEFDVAAMVIKMNQSHSTVLKKVKSLTGMSLVEFVKSHRLKRAAQILEKDSFQIAEVAYMVGFSDPKYFSKCFSKEFDKTPSEYVQEMKKIRSESES
jgi:signal transduction histidine kinase/ligand-binding sensor domain-containing protein/DNA-binding response OmpR family regulator